MIRAGAQRVRRSCPASLLWLLTPALALGGLCAVPLQARERPIVVDLEAVSAWQDRNAVQSPNTAASTRFAFDAVTGSGPFLAPRLQVSIPFGARQEWRLLAAPLSVDEQGALQAPVVFEGARFAAGGVRGKYRFDSWRVTWRYHWIDRPDLSVKLGFTAKIRDASIELQQGALAARKDNTGFVPLLHAAIERPLGTNWTLQADIDALAGGPGYAIDAGARLVRELGNGWSASLGLRWLDGGADNAEVYAFATFTSATIGISRRFD